MLMHTYTVIEYWRVYRTISVWITYCGRCLCTQPGVNSCERVPEETTVWCSYYTNMDLRLLTHNLEF